MGHYIFPMQICEHHLIGPIGCIPAISRTHEHTGECMEEANQMALYFNEKLSAIEFNNVLTFKKLNSSLFTISQYNVSIFIILTNAPRALFSISL